MTSVSPAAGPPLLNDDCLLSLPVLRECLEEIKQQYGAEEGANNSTCEYAARVLAAASCLRSGGGAYSLDRLACFKHWSGVALNKRWR